MFQYVYVDPETNLCLGRVQKLSTAVNSVRIIAGAIQPEDEIRTGSMVYRNDKDVFVAIKSSKGYLDRKENQTRKEGWLYYFFLFFMALIIFQK